MNVKKLIEENEIDQLNELILKEKLELTIEHYDLLDEKELNTCDCCKIIESTYWLYWITSEEYLEIGEELPEEVYEKYDALCSSCYEKLK